MKFGFFFSVLRSLFYHFRFTKIERTQGKYAIWLLRPPSNILTQAKEMGKCIILETSLHPQARPNGTVFLRRDERYENPKPFRTFERIFGPKIPANFFLAISVSTTGSENQHKLVGYLLKIGFIMVNVPEKGK